MFSTVFNLIGSDIERQSTWARQEASREVRTTATAAGLLTGAAVLCIGAFVIGVIALYVWLAPDYGALVALGVDGGICACLAIILLIAALLARKNRILDPSYVRRNRARSVPRSVKTSRPKSHALYETIRNSSFGPAITAGETVWKNSEHLSAAASEQLRDASRPTLAASLGAAALLGLIIGRRFDRGRLNAFTDKIMGDGLGEPGHKDILDHVLDRVAMHAKDFFSPK